MTSKNPSDVLPPLPPALKSISSYIQRAEELRTKDPVMAYWCTYYAAQLGLDLKSHEAGARDYLYALISLLEKMKRDLGANDAIENEAAGAAYVENFALKVFALADNEDRKGEASRSTAKKFLAAANFLELLRVFEKSNNAEVNDEKVRYAKWKASDIAKAFREGRKPTPGAAMSDIEGGSLTAGAETPTTAERSTNGAPPTVLSPDTGASKISHNTPPSAPKQLPGYIDVPPKDLSSSETWSTVATPGSEAVGPSSTSTKLAFASAMNRWKAQTDSEVLPPNPVPGRQDILPGQGNGSTDIDAFGRKVHFSPSVVGGLSTTDVSPPPSPVFRQTASIGPTYSANNVTAAHPHVYGTTGTSSFGRPDPTMAPLPDSSPSASSRASLDGSPPQDFNSSSGRKRSGSSPPVNSMAKPGSSPPGATGADRHSPPRSRRLSLQPSVPPPPPPPPAVPVDSRGYERRSSVLNRTSPSESTNLHLHPAYPPQSPNSSSLGPTSNFASLPGRSSGSPNRAPVSGLPPVASSPHMPTPYGAKYASKPPSPPTRHTIVAAQPSPAEELTPAQIAKAQKHCRFAISALEYEDAEQARKELRAALALLRDR